ncbi:hypothetical protein D3C77_711510 [compost metagenome]
MVCRQRLIIAMRKSMPMTTTGFSYLADGLRTSFAVIVKYLKLLKNFMRQRSLSDKFVMQAGFSSQQAYFKGLL